MTNAPILFAWDGESMSPARPSDARKCDEQFVIGARHALTEYKGRSMRSHRHYFACVREAWKNTPEHAAMSPWAASDEHMRKYALVMTGYRHTTTHVCQSHAEARRTATLLRSREEFAVVQVKENIVSIHEPESQSLEAMEAKRFQESKDAVLTYCSHLIGATPAALQAVAKEAA